MKPPRPLAYANTFRDGVSMRVGGDSPIAKQWAYGILLFIAGGFRAWFNGSGAAVNLLSICFIITKAGGKNLPPYLFAFENQRASYFLLRRAANARAAAPRTAATAAGSGTVKETDSEVSPKTASHCIPLVFPSNTVPAIELPVS